MKCTKHIIRLLLQTYCTVFRHKRAQCNAASYCIGKDTWTKGSGQIPIPQRPSVQPHSHLPSGKSNSVDALHMEELLNTTVSIWGSVQHEYGLSTWTCHTNGTRYAARAGYSALLSSISKELEETKYRGKMEKTPMDRFSKELKAKFSSAQPSWLKAQRAQRCLTHSTGTDLLAHGLQLLTINRQLHHWLLTTYFDIYMEVKFFGQSAHHSKASLLLSVNAWMWGLIILVTKTSDSATAGVMLHCCFPFAQVYPVIKITPLQWAVRRWIH